MINLRSLVRYSVSNYIKPKCCTVSFSAEKTSSASSDSDDEKKKSLNKQRSEEALKKLNSLLNQMIQEDAATSEQKAKLELAKPVDRRKSSVKTETDAEVKVDPAKQMLNAVKEVAKAVSGDVKQTESELLKKLLVPNKEEPAATTTANSLSELFKDMKIDRETKPPETISRAQQVRQLLQSVKMKQDIKTKGTIKKTVRKRATADESAEHQIFEDRVPLFGKESLGIFPPAAEISTWPKQNLNKTWNALEERELRLAVTHPPSNYFQEMIQWTEQKKIWRFPIDNEQDLDVEKSVDFTEHIFLEKHIESWCPPKGPIRHFMELVLVGLSKNPYLTVEHKKDHIEWFKNYFNEKKALLREVSAIPADFEFVKEDSNKIEA